VLTMGQFSVAIEVSVVRFERLFGIPAPGETGGAAAVQPRSELLMGWVDHIDVTPPTKFYLFS
jgi:hypothetical protein